MPSRPALALIVAGTALVLFLVWSGLSPYDRPTWALEVAPVVIALAIMVPTRLRFPLTSLLYFWIFVHAVVLIVGGTYTYARVPFGFQLADLLGITRNPYDKIGHFLQGFVPALVARETLLRGAWVRGAKMTAFICISIALAISACYELIEWAAALALGQGADEFLGTQGDPWDTQSDMAMALLGATCAVSLLAGWHDRQLAGLRKIAAQAR